MTNENVYLTKEQKEQLEEIKRKREEENKKIKEKIKREMEEEKVRIEEIKRKILEEQKQRKIKIDNASVKELTNEIMQLCKQLESKAESWFNPPATEKVISEWEKANGIIIPESYKEWLRLSNGAQILGHSTRFYGIDEFIACDKGIPSDLVVIGDLIGDGERLCFSKSSGKIIRYFGQKSDEYNNFKEILDWTIERIRGNM